MTGYGITCEAYSPVAPDPSGEGVSAAVRQALGTTPPGDVGWIKAHGTGTVVNDAAECRRLADVFGERLREVPLTSLKSTLGHCLGASGAVETVAAALALKLNLVPATAGTEAADPDLPACTVATRVLHTETDTVLLVAESFGRRCGALVLRRAARDLLER